MKINTDERMLKKSSFRNFFSIDDKTSENKNTNIVRKRRTLITNRSTSDLVAVNHDPGINKLMSEIAKKFLFK